MIYNKPVGHGVDGLCGLDKSAEDLAAEEEQGG